MPLLLENVAERRLDFRAFFERLKLHMGHFLCLDVSSNLADFAAYITILWQICFHTGRQSTPVHRDLFRHFGMIYVILFKRC